MPCMAQPDATNPTRQENERQASSAARPERIDPRANTLEIPDPQHQTSVNSDVISATKDGVKNENALTLPSFEHVETPPRIEGCKILGILGRGGMGVVYKALQIELNRVVALKMILSAALADPLAQQRFVGEAKAIAKLQHPNIVGLFEVGKYEGSPYFVLEYLSGGSLDDKINGKPQPPQWAAEVVVKLARGIQAAHDKGVIHRDLKPLNILIAADGEPKITDFGLAQQRMEVNPRTRTGEIIGTPYYMAPEQVDQRAPGVGPRTDVYALGAILYELLTGRPPLQGVTPMDTLLLVLKQEPVPPRRLNPAVSKDLETICLKCLIKEPSRRYGSAAELAEDLNRYLQQRPIKARPQPLSERARRWAARNPTIAALSAAMIILLVGGLALVSHLYFQSQANLADARRKFLLARDAVDKLTTAGDELQDAADIYRVRVEVLQEGLLFYQRFLAERSTDPNLRYQTATAYRRSGEIHYQLGQLKESEAAFSQAVALLGALLHEQSNHAATQLDLALAWKGYGITLANLRRFKDSEDAYRKAKSAAEELVTSLGLPEHRRLLADSLNNLGMRLIAQGRLVEAEEVVRRSFQLREALVNDDPSSLPRRLALASADFNLAFLLALQGRNDDAEHHGLQALRLRKQAVETQPGVSAHRKALADSHVELGELYAQQGRLPTAEIMYKEGLRLRRGLATEFPNVPSHRRDHGDAVFDYGVLLIRLDRATEATLQFRLAADLWQKLAADFPAREEYPKRAQLLNAYLLALQNQPHSAIAQVGEALARPGNDGESAFLAARVLALAASQHAADSVLRENTAKNALEALRQSWSRDYFRARWQPRELPTLPEFEPLLSRADFKEFLSSLAQP